MPGGTQGKGTVTVSVASEFPSMSSSSTQGVCVESVASEFPAMSSSTQDMRSVSVASGLVLSSVCIYVCMLLLMASIRVKCAV